MRLYFFTLPMRLLPLIKYVELSQRWQIKFHLTISVDRMRYRFDPVTIS